MNYDPKTQPQIILRLTRQDEGLAYRLKRSWHQYDSELLVSSTNDIPVSLYDPGIKAVINFDINAAAKGHCKACLIDVKVADAKDSGQLRTVNVNLLISYAKQCVGERFESRAIMTVVFQLHAAEEVLDGCIHRTASLGSSKIVLAKME
jgi:hypothetical protein